MLSKVSLENNFGKSVSEALKDELPTEEELADSPEKSYFELLQKRLDQNKEKKCKATFDILLYMLLEAMNPRQDKSRTAVRAELIKRIVVTVARAESGGKAELSPSMELVYKVFEIAQTPEDQFIGAFPGKSESMIAPLRDIAKRIKDSVGQYEEVHTGATWVETAEGL